MVIKDTHPEFDEKLDHMRPHYGNSGAIHRLLGSYCGKEVTIYEFRHFMEDDGDTGPRNSNSTSQITGKLLEVTTRERPYLVIKQDGRERTVYFFERTDLHDGHDMTLIEKVEYEGQRIWP